VTVSVNPSSVTVETNQLIRFLAHGLNSAGDSVFAPITWHTTGGTILPDGRFTSAAAGTFMVTGRTRDRGEERVDTSVVTVVRRQLQLNAIEIAPGTVTLAPGVSQSFVVTGRLKDGRAVPVGVVWGATGGSIDAGGKYVAGDTAGTYLVTATNTAMTVADTAIVTITAPPAPPPPPPAAPPEEPAPPPAPILEKVTLIPASATLAPGASRQFSAYGRNSVGDSVAVSVSFIATGGTITSEGRYTAGSSAGSFRVIASSSGLADTSTVTVTQPLGSGPSTGITFGNFAPPSAESGTQVIELSAPYSGAVKVLQPTNIIRYLDLARARKMRVIGSFVGGPNNYRNADGTFSLTLWKQRMDRFKGMNLSSYINDGTLVGNFLLDEPHDPTNWAGTKVTFAQIEAMAQHSKQLFPTMTTFVRVHPSWLKGYTWKYLDAAWAQYSHRYGNLSTYIQTNVADAKALGLGLITGMNTIHGGDGSSGLYGTPDRPTSYQMSPTEIRTYGKALAGHPYACGFIMWAYWTEFNERADIKSAMQDVAQVAANRPTAPCRVR
jgi:hypothetical protein